MNSAWPDRQGRKAGYLQFADNQPSIMSFEMGMEDIVRLSRTHKSFLNEIISYSVFN